MPKRVQMRRDRPWRQDHPDAVIVARPTRWGNPFRIGCRVGDGPLLSAGREILSNAAAVAAFRTMLSLAPRNYPSEEEIRAALAGRDLACWCPLDQPCHADVLLEIANRGQKCPTARSDRGTLSRKRPMNQ